MIESAKQNLFFEYRFEFIGLLLTTILFGGAFFPALFFQDYVLPFVILALSFSAINLSKGKHPIFRILSYLFSGMTILLLILRMISKQEGYLQSSSLIIFILFFGLLSFLVFEQMFLEKDVNHNIIIAAFDNYLLLGLIGAMIFNLIHLHTPNAFVGISPGTGVLDKTLYFSFITLTSIGYGDITPDHQLSEKVTAFFGLVGHFYSVVIVGIIVGKYVANKTS